MLWVLALVGCVKQVPVPPTGSPTVESIDGLPGQIAFGSCSKQTKDQPILDVILRTNPDLMIYLGDNIYADTRLPGRMRAKYARLARRPEFARLQQGVPIVSTWDDHDYGTNDGNKLYEMKEASKAAFMDFWGVPESSERRQRPGIYGHHLFEAAGRRLQLIVLDTRWFLDPLQENLPDDDRAYDYPFKNQYQPSDDPELTLLGAAQWRWLEARLKEPADLRIIASSIQFGHTYNGYESWNNLPEEKARLQQLIRDTGAKGVLILSGDVHWGEISRMQPDIVDYPLYDVTSSGLTQIWKSTEVNENRLGRVVSEEHFGLLKIDWSAADPAITMELRGLSGETLNAETVRASELGWQPQE